MKKQYYIMLTIFFIVMSSLVLSQNFIKDFPGIPIEIGYDWWYTYRPETFSKMKEMGVDIIHGNLSEGWQLDTLRAYGLKIIPLKSFNNDWIQLYTDAKYTKWEAEGTPLEIGEATLEPDTTTEVIMGSNETYIRLKSVYAGLIDTLIKGPYYTQEVYYIVNNDGIPVEYWADFRMKLELNASFSDNVNSDLPLCILQVTQSRIYPNNSPPWTLECTYVIEQDTITRGMFNSLNEFNEFRLKYDLGRNDCQITAESDPAQYRMLFSDTNPRMLRSYIQFKVIWLGTPNYIPSLDRVIVSDQRGRDLKDPTKPAASNIISQACSTIVNNEDVIAGWFGIDEPHSIDNFEPIRVVDSILNSKSNDTRPAWFPMMTQWLGAWDNPANTLGTMGVNRVKEFYSRLGGKANIFQTYHLYDQPYETNYGGLYPCNCLDFRDKNIEYMVKNNYNLDYEQDKNFGVSIQCSKQVNTQAHLRDVRPWELLYNTNMALMTGAKYIQLYTYFAERELNDPNTIYTTTGMINSINYQLDYTDKYNMWRDTLKPRLHGLFGKTIKTIDPTQQLLNIIAGQFSGAEYISNIQASRADIPGENEYIAVYNDLGFFEKGDKEYFMLLNRWYNVHSKFKYTITINHPDGFNNYRITDYVDTTECFIQNGSYFVDTISKGDARLYSILPVVKHGGKLIANETISVPTTLTEDMTIENGATLYVNSIYTVKGNITVKNGGKIIGGSYGQIVFTNGKQLIIEGSVQINGTANNRLKLFYEPTTEIGIKVKQGADLIISHCDVMESVVGISTEPNFQSIKIENVNIVDCLGSGIGLIGPVNRHSEATPVVKNCKIMHCGIGISAANISELVIMQDSIMACNMGNICITCASSFHCWK